MKLALSILVLSSTLVACSAKPVLPVAEPNPPVASVQQDVSAHQNMPITWGGIILETNNAEKQSEILIITKRLTSSTRPIEGDQTLGRFIARVDGFLDPAIYAQDREISIHGIIIGKDIRKVDSYDYTYPIVQVSQHHLWPVRVEYNDGYYDNYWYAPYYHPYPYYHHHPRSIQSIEKH